jgi:predicted CXXCH cytochrome family protein
VHYRITREGEKVWLSFDRDGNDPLHGKRELRYYIGSGVRGRTYVFQVDGFYFEAPINWYGDRKQWDMTPAYQKVGEAPLNLPLQQSCTFCHLSGYPAPEKGTESKYGRLNPVHAGIDCERCHGDSNAHLRGGKIVNPAKLDAAKRDSVCMQCHMEATAAIDLPGKSQYEYRPGMDISEVVRYYTLEGGTERLGAVSQVQAMAESGCKRGAGERMSCTSCHDPHSSPTAAERVQYFRNKCLACHGAEFGAKHHQEQPDCTSCHMPKSASSDVAHTQVTDHRIPRYRVAIANASTSAEPKLQPFLHTKAAQADVRSLALAWASLAQRGMKYAGPVADRLLNEQSKRTPNDIAVVSALAWSEQTHGHSEAAEGLYKRALQLDPTELDAAASLGQLQVERGEVREGVRRWMDVFERAPERTEVAINISRAFCAAGLQKEAQQVAERALDFNPDSHDGKLTQRKVAKDPPECR